MIRRLIKRKEIRDDLENYPVVELLLHPDAYGKARALNSREPVPAGAEWCGCAPIDGPSDLECRADQSGIRKPDLSGRPVERHDIIAAADNDVGGVTASLDVDPRAVFQLDEPGRVKFSDGGFSEISFGTPAHSHELSVSEKWKTVVDCRARVSAVDADE